MAAAATTQNATKNREKSLERGVYYRNINNVARCNQIKASYVQIENMYLSSEMNRVEQF